MLSRLKPRGADVGNLVTAKVLLDQCQNRWVLIKHIGASNRGVKTANFSVLRRTRHPAVLVEGGFISNSKERSALTDPKYRQVVADSVARGIMQFDGRR